MQGGDGAHLLIVDELRKTRKKKKKKKKKKKNNNNNNNMFVYALCYVYAECFFTCKVTTLI